MKSVLTKEKDGELLRSTFSCDQIISEGKLGVTRPSMASTSKHEFFNKVTKNSACGTVVILSHLDPNI